MSSHIHFSSLCCFLSASSAASSSSEQALPFYPSPRALHWSNPQIAVMCDRLVPAERFPCPHSHAAERLSAPRTAIFIGLAFGGLFLAFAGPDERDKINFQPQFFFYVLLPPIIFDAGYSLKRRLFFRNLLPILTLAIIGTILSTAVISAMLALATQVGWIGKEVRTLRTLRSHLASAAEDEACHDLLPLAPSGRR